MEWGSIVLISACPCTGVNVSLEVFLVPKFVVKDSRRGQSKADSKALDALLVASTTGFSEDGNPISFLQFSVVPKGARDGYGTALDGLAIAKHLRGGEAVGFGLFIGIQSCPMSGQFFKPSILASIRRKLMPSFAGLRILLDGKFCKSPIRFLGKAISSSSSMSLVPDSEALKRFLDGVSCLLPADLDGEYFFLLFLTIS